MFSPASTSSAFGGSGETARKRGGKGAQGGGKGGRGGGGGRREGIH